MKLDKITIGILAFVAIFGIYLAISNIESELPEKYQGQMEMSGIITSCSVSKLGKKSDKYFLGITLDSDKSTLLQLNPLINDREVYAKLCNSNPPVSIKYHAKKRGDGPVRFWIDSIELKQT